jgi:hypothetical protein
MHKNVTKCNETLSKWCKNKHGASKIIDTFETYQRFTPEIPARGRKFRVSLKAKIPAWGQKFRPLEIFILKIPALY